MSVQLTSILVTSMLLVKILRAHTPVREKLDLREIEEHGKSVMKKVPVQSFLAMALKKINFQSCVIILNLHQTYIFLLGSSYT